MEQVKLGSTPESGLQKTVDKPKVDTVVLGGVAIVTMLKPDLQDIPAKLCPRHTSEI